MFILLIYRFFFMIYWTDFRYIGTLELSYWKLFRNEVKKAIYWIFFVIHCLMNVMFGQISCVAQKILKNIGKISNILEILGSAFWNFGVFEHNRFRRFTRDPSGCRTGPDKLVNSSRNQCCPEGSSG